MAGPYTWLTQTQAISALQARLNNSQFWTTTELWRYLSEALRVLNSHTEQWEADWAPTGAQNGAWVNVGTTSTSPRLRTVTDAALYTQMQDMLLEPESGAGTWTGSSQFALVDLQNALQRRVQEVIQATACNLTQLSPIAATPVARRYALGDTVLEPRRNRFLPVVANVLATGSSGSSSLTLSVSGLAQKFQIITGTGIQPGTFVTSASGTAIALSLPTTAPLSGTLVQLIQPITLSREDTKAFEYYEPDYLQENGVPVAWSVASEPPLAFDVDITPNTPGTFDIIALISGPTFAPPASTLLGVPDDWSWVPMYGALADILGKEPESTDRVRAAYCLKRYEMGLEVMKNSNWLLKATIDGVAVSTPSLYEMDQWAPEWQASNMNLAMVVQAGIDLVAPTPSTTPPQQLSLKLVGNAPLLDGSNNVQVSRDDFESILNYAQHIAEFKDGNQMFAGTQSLLQDFFRALTADNKRLLTYGLYSTTLKSEGQKQELWVAR